MTARSLHIYVYAGVEYFIAHSLEDAIAVGKAEPSITHEWDPSRWKPLLDAERLAIHFKNGVISEEHMCDSSEYGGMRIEKTMREWADRFGRGYLCTTEL